MNLGPDEWFMVILASTIIFGIIGPKFVREVRARNAEKTDP